MIKRIAALLLVCTLLALCCACSSEAPMEPTYNTDILFDAEPSDDEPLVELSREAAAIARIFGECDAFYQKPFDDVLTRYGELYEEGKETGFVPVIIFPDDSMVRHVYSNLDLFEYVEGDLENAPQGVIEMMVANTIERARDMTGASAMSLLKTERGNRFDVDAFENKNGITPDTVNTLTEPDNEYDWVLIVRVDRDNAWQVFAQLPIGGWNECPSPTLMCAITRYWFEYYGATPAIITSDSVQFMLEQTPPEDTLRALASEQYCFAPQSAFFEHSGAKNCAVALKDSTVWKFAWEHA